MPDIQLVTDVQRAIVRCGSGSFRGRASALLEVLGYPDERNLNALDGSPDGFVAEFPSQPGSEVVDPDTNSKRLFLSEVTGIDLLFQITDDELGRASVSDGLQHPLIQGRITPTIVRSFVFAAVELRSGEYTNSEYAALTREVNKRLSQATVVLFRNAATNLTIGFVHRREHKRRSDRTVLENVSLIKEVNTSDPHPAHVRILADLQLANLLSSARQWTFQELMDAWLKVLDTKELNRRFYRELLRWFEKTIQTATFPTKERVRHSPQIHVIRLVTRMMFIWFLKEKQLVAWQLFNPDQLDSLLNDFNPSQGDSYYRAVLQNLFFATLSTEIPDRSFSSKNSNTHRVFQNWRYRDEMADPERMSKMFNQSPFINGGLFDCLDSEESRGAGGYRIDFFTDPDDPELTAYNRSQLSIPNHLFFDEPDGLISIFNHYKFTVTESTPVEQEVALDPELLGNVFENLLAEVGEGDDQQAAVRTRRKETGSFYTPPSVVDFMATEAIAHALLPKIGEVDETDREFVLERLRYLLDFADECDDASILFTQKEVEAIVEGISKLRILDPAVGSGAFPMGVLRKLTLMLKRLDPYYKLWIELHIDQVRQRLHAINRTTGETARDRQVQEAKDLIDSLPQNDHWRKLLLIWNGIFGVDIQPIAIQIAKLRFFISLAIEQTRTDNPDENFGIEPLPNLESRFVAADFVQPLFPDRQATLERTARIDEIEHEIAANARRHFLAAARQDKLRYANQDRTLRAQLADEMVNQGWPSDRASKVAKWDRFDASNPEEWFDAAWMFDINEGFDIVVGNPPYVQLERDEGRLGIKYSSAGYETFAKKGDIYYLFLERGLRELGVLGCLTYIVSNSWMNAKFASPLRDLMEECYQPLQLVATGSNVFENSDVDTVIVTIAQPEFPARLRTFNARDIHVDRFQLDESEWSDWQPNPSGFWNVLSVSESRVLQAMNDAGQRLGDWKSIKTFEGIKTGRDSVFVVDGLWRSEMLSHEPAATDIIVPYINGRDIHPYGLSWRDTWLIDIPPGFLAREGEDELSLTQREHQFKSRYPHIFGYLSDHKGTLERRSLSASHEWYALQRPRPRLRTGMGELKLYWRQITNLPSFALVQDEILPDTKGFVMLGRPLPFLCGVLNSSLVAWWMRNNATTTPYGTIQWKAHTVDALPVPMPSDSHQHQLESLVEEATRVRSKDVTGDVAGLQREMDSLVYDLYGLTPSEIAIVEDRMTRQRG